MNNTDNTFYADRIERTLECWEAIMGTDGVFKSDNDELAMFTYEENTIITIKKSDSITELKFSDEDHSMRIYLTDDELKTFTKMIVKHYLETIWRAKE